VQVRRTGTGETGKRLTAICGEEGARVEVGQKAAEEGHRAKVAHEAEKHRYLPRVVAQRFSDSFRLRGDPQSHIGPSPSHQGQPDGADTPEAQHFAPGRDEERDE
jgi:hypothetical protein